MVTSAEGKKLGPTAPCSQQTIKKSELLKNLYKLTLIATFTYLSGSENTLLKSGFSLKKFSDG